MSNKKRKNKPTKPLVRLIEGFIDDQYVINTFYYYEILELREKLLKKQEKHIKKQAEKEPKRLFQEKIKKTSGEFNGFTYEFIPCRGIVSLYGDASKTKKIELDTAEIVKLRSAATKLQPIQLVLGNKFTSEKFRIYIFIEMFNIKTFTFHEEYSIDSFCRSLQISNLNTEFKAHYDLLDSDDIKQAIKEHVTEFLGINEAASTTTTDPYAYENRLTGDKLKQIRESMGLTFEEFAGWFCASTLTASKIKYIEAKAEKNEDETEPLSFEIQERTQNLLVQKSMLASKLAGLITDQTKAPDELQIPANICELVDNHPTLLAIARNIIQNGA